MIKKILEIPKYIGLFLIRCYQKTLSFDHSFWARPDLVRVCVFYPSCSEYTYLAIERYGLIKGAILGSWRILRCNPFSKGGIDDIPNSFLGSKGEPPATHKHSQKG